MKTVSKWSVFQSSVTVMLTVVFALASAWFAGAAQTNYTWNVSTPLSTSAWNANGNWLANGSLTYGFPGDGGDTADTVTFGNIGTNNNNSTTPNNVVTANTTISTLLYTNILSTSWHVMDIQSGITLTVTNMTVGVFGNPMTNATENANVTDVAMVDAGTLFVCSNLFVGCEGSNSAPADSTLNMLGLSNFVMNASAGTLQIGVGPRSAANVDLANQSNYIQVATFSDNIVSSSSSVTGNLQLGGGTNIIYASTFSIAGNRGNSTVSFPAGSTGGLLVRGTAGTTASLCNLTVGNRNNSGGSGNNGIGTLSFVGHPVNLYLSTLTMGESGSNPSGAAPGTGTLSFDTGTVYASNVIMAVSSGSTVGVNANGIINVGSTGNTANPPTLFIGSGGMSLVNMTGSTAGTALGMLNITNAMIFCSNSVVQTTISGTGVVNVATGGNLYMVGGTVGTAAIPINTVKITSGTLVLSNTVGSATANVYSTNVIASSGTIIITNIGGTIPSFSTTTIPLINYSGGGAASPAGGLTLVMNPAITNSLAGAVLATLHDSGTQIQLQFTPTAAPPPLAIWTGATNGDWDYTTTNWAVAGTPTNYADGDLVQFDDTLLSNNVINLTTTLNPAQTTVSNANENYTFNGTGSVTNGALIKLGTDSLILDNSGANTFTSVAITNGTVQIGNGDNLGSRVPAA